ncbi:MAG: C4-dicarboxylate transporter DcuC [Bacteroidota bacterium]
MDFTGPIIAILVIAVVVMLLLRKVYPHAVLLFAGLLMLSIGFLLDGQLPTLKKPSGTFGLDIFKYVTAAFAKTNAGVGLMIMAIGGFVAYIDSIGASKALVKLAMKPLGLLRKTPNLAAAAVIPIGQILFVAIPSAAGLSLLLMASVFPILKNLGVSNLSAVSVITATTAVGMGPASAVTVSASTLLEMPTVEYFVSNQLPLFIPLTIALTITYFFVIRYHHRRDMTEEVQEQKSHDHEEDKTAPSFYALIPILPILLLVFFSEFNSLLSKPLSLDTTTAMFISLFVAMIFEGIRKRSFSEALSSLKTFWNGMGNIFKTVVTLIIAAEIFSKGLISLGFIDGLLYVSQNIGFGPIGIGVLMTIMIFLASMLMGSGNAAFFSFGPLVPSMASNLGVKGVTMILPMNFAASMGRTVSPVAGVIIATSEIAGVSTFQIVKRNLIPIAATFLTMLIYHFI